MSTCKQCGVGLVAAEEEKGICYKCEQAEAHGDVKAMLKENEARISSIIITTETSPPFEIQERLGVIGGECVYGTNIFRELFTNVRDVVGGRSKASQNILRDGRREALSDLRRAADEIGANAVISTRIEYSQMSGKSDQLLVVAAIGTAVKIIP